MSSGTDTPLRALVVGESWIKHTVHVKGFDHFQTTEYEEGAHVFLDALRASNIDVTYIRAHEISRDFPTRAADLDTFDVVILSDVGSNSFLLTDETFLKSQRSVNRLTLLADFVEAGGGLVMVGGYMSFTGIDGRARFNMSPLASVLPVTMLDYDDRIETPEGFIVTVDAPDHPVLGDVIGEWPILLGYNRIAAKPDATVVASHGQDPILVVGAAGWAARSRSPQILRHTGRRQNFSTGNTTVSSGQGSCARPPAEKSKLRRPAGTRRPRRAELRAASFHQEVWWPGTTISVAGPPATTDAPMRLLQASSSVLFFANGSDEARPCPARSRILAEAPAAIGHLQLRR